MNPESEHFIQFDLVNDMLAVPNLIRSVDVDTPLRARKVGNAFAPQFV